jgi:hypothetical protein
VREQEPQRLDIIQIQRAIEHHAFDTRARCQKKAHTGDVFQRMVERLAVVGIGASIEQEPGQFCVAVLPRCPVERG